MTFVSCLEIAYMAAKKRAINTKLLTVLNMLPHDSKAWPTNVLPRAPMHKQQYRRKNRSLAIDLTGELHGSPISTEKSSQFLHFSRYQESLFPAARTRQIHKCLHPANGCPDLEASLEG